MIVELGLLDTNDTYIGGNKMPMITKSKNKIRVMYEKGIPRIKSKIDLMVAHDDSIYEIDALWDTGASMSFINEKLARKLKLIPVDTGKVVTINGSKEAVYYIVDVALSGDIVFRNLKVCGAQANREDIEFIIGMDIISKGDFSIKNNSTGMVMEFEYIKKNESQ